MYLKLEVKPGDRLLPPVQDAVELRPEPILELRDLGGIRLDLDDEVTSVVGISVGMLHLECRDSSCIVLSTLFTWSICCGRRSSMETPHSDKVGPLGPRIHGGGGTKGFAGGGAAICLRPLGAGIWPLGKRGIRAGGVTRVLASSGAV